MGMDVVFYDRKNKCEVRSSQMIDTGKVVRFIVGCDSPQEGKLSFDNMNHLEDNIADVVYKTAKCPSYCNWDNFTQLKDLVFLKLEEMED